MKTTILLFFFFASHAGMSQISEKSTFDFCPDMPMYPYYHFGELNERSFNEIKTYFRADYPAAEMTAASNNTGIITVQFKLNCNGEAGGFSAFSCDLSYIKNEINPELLDYFLQKTKELGGWKKVIDVEGVAGNAHKFYSFRIVNGELIEILPK